MSVEIRIGTSADLAAIIAIDPAMGIAERRHDYLSKALAGFGGSSVKVLVLDGQIAGFAIMSEFFGHPFLERITTAENRRRAGVASALMTHIEMGIDDDRMFVSTNESNEVMRTLLAARNYKVSGVVENLDPGDPELFFVIFKTDIDAAIEAAR
ncbi:GNAT family N-acetyltransferase [Phenylobacterium aquaticum]|uniref:GNAT family N-acetyltransferase n=1 Tax=Phenylobacterium aquaticum TaxID=1763816 RepID=UPI001F5DE6F3|nr:GNAT family N-acetyltransferase [Phenylobacterium aquaticum]MCI3132320.1 GNAT family N-acetyltransferase [Phenylobacterium aquaticum]